MDDVTTKTLEIALLFVDRMQKALSFYTGIPLSEVVSSIDMYDVVYNYTVSAIIKAVERNTPLMEPPLMWDDTEYHLYAPSESVSETITQDEFNATCLIATYCREISDGNYVNMIPVVAAYLRLVEEPFSADLIAPEGVRCTLFQDLPLDLALYTLGNMNYTEMNDIIQQYITDQTT
jgi:hypothetical protein